MFNPKENVQFLFQAWLLLTRFYTVMTNHHFNKIKTKSNRNGHLKINISYVWFLYISLIHISMVIYDFRIAFNIYNLNNFRRGWIVKNGATLTRFVVLFTMYIQLNHVQLDNFFPNFFFICKKFWQNCSFMLKAL